MRATTAPQIWAKLSTTADPWLKKAEHAASLTLPNLMLPEGTTGWDELVHDWQSVGAQGVKHILNKYMLAMFAPSRPFFRLGLNKVAKEAASKLGMTESDIGQSLANAEKEAIKQLDSSAQRPKIARGVALIIVTGQVLMHIGEDELRFQSLKYWRVKRDIHGKMKQLIIKERVLFDELDQEVQAVTRAYHTEDSMVDYYRLVNRTPTGTGYIETQWVNGIQLDNRFTSVYSIEDCPYHVVAWDLPDESDYSPGLIEENFGDLNAVSATMRAEIEGGIQACETRWMVNQGGGTSVDDFKGSVNGQALPGSKDDLTPVTGGNPQGVAEVRMTSERVEQRLARVFLLGSAVTRDAERVTAEEMRQQALELQVAHGGTYSVLAPSLQSPIARWLLNKLDADILKTQFAFTVITGLDALSRNGDLEAFRQAMGDIAQFYQLPAELVARTKWMKVYEFVGQGRGIDMLPFLMNDTEWDAKQQQAQQSRVQEANQVASGEAAAQATTQS